jgi:hypothetical protein
VFRRIHKVHKASGRLSCFTLLAVFAVFPGKLSAINASFSAEILDRRRFGEQKNSKARCCFPLFLWINRTVAKVALLWQAVSAQRLIDLNIRNDIIRVMFRQYDKYLFRTARHCRAARPQSSVWAAALIMFADKWRLSRRNRQNYPARRKKPGILPPPAERAVAPLPDNTPDLGLPGADRPVHCCQPPHARGGGRGAAPRGASGCLPPQPKPAARDTGTASPLSISVHSCTI